MLSKRSFTLLSELAADNSKRWFDAHRDAVRVELQEPFVAVLEAVTQRLAGSSMPLIGSKQTVFRMNRDTRFSKDKSPYKTTLGGLLTPSGRKATADGLTYLHLDAYGGFVASGYYQLSPQELAPLRDTIVAHPQELQHTLDMLAKSKLEPAREGSLTAMPRGYAEHKGAWFADYLKLQSFIVQRKLTKKSWLCGTVIDETADFTLAAASLIEFGHRS